MVIAAHSVLEEINRVNVFTDRVKKLRDEYLAATGGISAERSRISTDTWKETDGQPNVLRQAKAFKRIVEEIPIFIRDGELIVGSETKYVRGAHASPEWCGELLRRLETPKPVIGRLQTTITEEDRKSLSEHLDYWKDRSLYAEIYKVCKEIYGSLYDDVIEERILTNAAGANMASSVPDWEYVFNKGLNGIIADVKEQKAKLSFSHREEVEKLHFLDAVIMSCEAAIHYAHRHAELARQLASKEKDPKRKAELRKIAEACGWVPANTPRTLHEALQAYWFLFVTTRFEPGAAPAQVIGRLDQYLYPFYEKDIKSGVVTRQEVAELLTCLWIKLLQVQTVRELGANERTIGSEFINATIGGVTKNGEDASNELTFLILEVIRQLKPHQPHVTFRYHDGVDDEVFMKALETERDVGAGIPQFANDKVEIARFLAFGVPLADARNWVGYGCYHPRIPGGGTDNSLIIISWPKVFELTLNNGVNPRTGRQVGLATGDPRKFTSIGELIQAFKTQVGYFAGMASTHHRVTNAVRRKKFPLPFNSALSPECIKEGKSLYEGGGKYPQLNNQFCDRGHVNVADSLVAIKKLVFEEKKLTMGELLDALKVNFEGKEDIRQMLLATPKYGNDDDEADEMMRELFNWTGKEIAKQANPWGYPQLTEAHGTSYHYFAGKTVGALPDGRKAYTSIADGGCSPMTGMDVRGPTAVLNSAAKLDHMLRGSVVLNQKFSPTALQNREQLRKLGAMIKTYFDQYGHHVQYNVVSRETLLEAKKSPEKYRDLIVRVAGYSAFFVELDPELQDEIIARTEFTSC